MNTQKYFIYARKSTDDTSRQVRSIDDQLAEVRELATRNNLQIVEIFVERQTAKTPGRPVFNEMLSRIEEGEANGIIAWHPDRLARNSLDGGRIIYLVDTGKIVDLRFPTYKFDATAQGKFMLSVMFGQSKYYVDNLSENIKRGQRQKLKNGIWPQWAPLGYLNDRSTKTIVPDANKAPLVKKMFEMYATGDYTLSQVREIVVNLGLRGKLEKPPSVSKVQYALRNPIYHGIIRFNEELYEGMHEPLISKTLFDKCQEVMERKSHWKKSKHKDFLYRGAIRCGECGCQITMEVQKGHQYLRCTKKKGACSQSYMREEKLAAQVSEQIRRVAISDEWAELFFEEIKRAQAEEYAATQKHQEKLRQDITLCDLRQSRLMNAFLDRVISEEEYKQTKNQIILEKKQIQENIVSFAGIEQGWLELFKRFVTLANKATYIASEGDETTQWQFFKKVGSNLTLRDGNLLWVPKGVWQSVMDKEVLKQSEEEAQKKGGRKAAKRVLNSIERRERDSNPRYGEFPVRRFSKPLHSAALPSLQNIYL